MKDISKEKLLEILNISLSKRDFFRNLGYKIEKSGINKAKIDQWNKICNNYGLKDFLFYIKQNKLKIKTVKCKNCGKDFIKNKNEIFCCRDCANKYIGKNISYKSKIKRINGSKKYSKQFLEKYNENPSKCIICGNIIPYKKWRYGKTKTCCKECAIKLRVQNTNYKNCGGYREGCYGYGKQGWYKGIFCGSTYELAYLIYCLDHNIDIKRCTETFEYELNGKKHTYHPDFVVEGIITEIKGYDRGDVSAKMKSLGNRPYKLLYYKDIIKEMNYVAETYNKKVGNKGQNNFYELYDASIV